LEDATAAGPSLHARGSTREECRPIFPRTVRK
jgi:hypothetical protein